MGQPSGSWCILCSNLPSFLKVEKNKPSHFEFVDCICLCLFFFFYAMSWVSVTVHKMILTLKPHDMAATFALHLFFSAIDPNTESVEDLMQRFQDSFRVPNTPTDMSHYQHVMHSSSTGRRRVPSHTRGMEQKVTQKVYSVLPQAVIDLSWKIIYNTLMVSFIFIQFPPSCFFYNFDRNIWLYVWAVSIRLDVMCKFTHFLSTSQHPGCH